VTDSTDSTDATGSPNSSNALHSSDAETPEPDLYDSLAGQVALVTGANRGLGAEVARELVALDATVFAGSRSVRNETPAGTERVLLDVTQAGEVEAAVEEVVGEAGRLDVLVNNAGVLHRGDDLVDEPTGEIDRTLATNLRGPLLCCKYALPHLLERPGGRVVNVSSGLGQLSGEQDGDTPAYRVSKTGLNGLTAYLHGEYADEGLLANSVSPGWVASDMGRQDDRNPPRSVETGAETPVWLCRFRPGAPAGLFWKDRETRPW
jgi:NAD(P)-dependent dehydrogenase (short-subunit alcohol dehydrogenase family)